MPCGPGTLWSNGWAVRAPRTPRYTLSVRFNRDGWFPWGTFSANMLGTVVLGITTIVLDRPRDVVLSRWEQAALYGLGNGFCGCLSTVSTWVFELRSLTTVPERAVRYGMFTVLWAQALLLGTIGVYNWVHGADTG
eukprot:m.77504 g.77504  ORF g.77504 m.77504 type:complete len:136 (+) comp19115_c0_seq5:956-1363(+)